MIREDIIRDWADLENKTNGRISEEIWLLAQHQKGTLERRFPGIIVVSLYEHPDHYLRLEVWKETLIGVRVQRRPPIHRVLIAFFSSSCVQIVPPSTTDLVGYSKLSHDTLSLFTEAIDYADPRFTDDIFSEILEGT